MALHSGISGCYSSFFQFEFALSLTVCFKMTTEMWNKYFWLFSPPLSVCAGPAVPLQRHRHGGSVQRLPRGHDWRRARAGRRSVQSGSGVCGHRRHAEQLPVLQQRSETQLRPDTEFAHLLSFSLLIMNIFAFLPFKTRNSFSQIYFKDQSCVVFNATEETVANSPCWWLVHGGSDISTSQWFAELQFIVIHLILYYVLRIWLNI